MKNVVVIGSSGAIGKAFIDSYIKDDDVENDDNYENNEKRGKKICHDVCGYSRGLIVCNVVAFCSLASAGCVLIPDMMKLCVAIAHCFRAPCGYDKINLYNHSGRWRSWLKFL